MIAAALCLGLLMPQFQSGDSMFAITGKGEDRRVSADRPSVSAADALRTLGTVMGWDVEFETVGLRENLANRPLALAFVDQDPRTIASLIAAAGNADVVFDDVSRAALLRPQANIVSLPSADTESGRNRLMKHSVDWYHTFLQEELSFEPLRKREGMRARMDLAKLLMDRGDYDTAAEQYLQVHKENRTHEYVPLALLKLSECFYEMGAQLQRRVDSKDAVIAEEARAEQGEFFDKSEKYARLVSERHAEKWESAKATVFLGKIMLAQQRYSECVNFMTANYLRLTGTPEIVDLYLITGQAEQARGNTQRVLDAMLTLEGALDEFRGMTREQMLDYLFMRADALQRLGHHEEAVFTVHEFFGLGPGDGRRGAAFVIMGRAYLALGQVLEAWSAALEAHSLRPIMDRNWAREEGRFYAKAALEVGDRDEAFERLELEVRDRPESEPELVLYLVDAFVAQGRFEKAVITAALLVDYEDEWGDQARMKTVEAMWKQADAANQMAGFPRKALPYALRIKDKSKQEAVSELFGKAYERMGLIDLAAKAYRGILQ